MQQYAQYLLKRLSYLAIVPYVAKRKTLLFALIILISLLLLLTPKSNAATLPTYPDCSDFITLPTDWTTKLQEQVTSQGGGTISSSWSVMGFMDDFNTNQRNIYFYASPVNNAGSPPFWITANTTDPRKLLENYNSSRGDIYRVYYNGAVWGTQYTYNVAGNYSGTRVLQCAFFNKNIVLPYNASNVYNFNFESPVPATNIGFNQKPTVSGSTSSSGVTKTELTDLLIQFSALGLSIFIAYKIIMFFRFRRVF